MYSAVTGSADLILQNYILDILEFQILSVISDFCILYFVCYLRHCIHFSEEASAAQELLKYQAELLKSQVLRKSYVLCLFQVLIAVFRGFKPSKFRGRSSLGSEF